MACVYMGCHGNSYPETTADKHKEHVVWGLRAPLSVLEVTTLVRLKKNNNDAFLMF